MPEMHVELEKRFARINAYLDLISSDEFVNAFVAEHDYDIIGAECQSAFLREISKRISTELEYLEIQIRNES